MINDIQVLFYFFNTSSEGSNPKLTKNIFLLLFIPSTSNFLLPQTPNFFLSFSDLKLNHFTKTGGQKTIIMPIVFKWDFQLILKLHKNYLISFSGSFLLTLSRFLFIVLYFYLFIVAKTRLNEVVSLCWGHLGVDDDV